MTFSSIHSTSEDKKVTFGVILGTHVRLTLETLHVSLIPNL